MPDLEKVDGKSTGSKLGPRGTITKLARRAGLDVTHLSRILRQERVPNVITFSHIAKAAQMPMDKLFKIIYGDLK